MEMPTRLPLKQMIKLYGLTLSYYMENSSPVVDENVQRDVYLGKIFIKIEVGYIALHPLHGPTCYSFDLGYPSLE